LSEFLIFISLYQFVPFWRGYEPYLAGSSNHLEIQERLFDPPKVNFCFKEERACKGADAFWSMGDNPSGFQCQL